MSALVLPTRHTVRAKWAPLYYYPVFGSPDRLTVAVIAFTDDGTQVAIAEAPGLHRMHCLFGEQAKAPLSLIKGTIDALKKDINERRISALTEPKLLFSGFEFGEMRSGSGFALNDIAQRWVNAISVFSAEKNAPAEIEVSLPTVVELRPSERSGRLVPSVRKEVQARIPLISGEFNYSFRSRTKVVPVRIGFLGRNIVADFSRISTRSLSNNVERIRSKLWVLADHRDEAPNMMDIPHEMIVLRNSASDPSVSRSDLKAIDAACHDLEIEADRRSIRLRPLNSVEDIAERIIEAEAA